MKANLQSKKMTPLDLWPNLAATYMQAPKPTTPWRYASIQEAHTRMSPWNFFLYALVAYADAFVAWIQYMSNSAADAATQAASLFIMQQAAFNSIRGSTDALAKTLRGEHPNQDSYFLERILHENKKEILQEQSWNLMIACEGKILEELKQLLPDAKTLLDNIYNLKSQLNSHKSSFKSSFENQNKGFQELFSMNSEDQLASHDLGHPEVRGQIFHLWSLLTQLFNVKKDPTHFNKLWEIRYHVY